MVRSTVNVCGSVIIVSSILRTALVRESNCAHTADRQPAVHSTALHGLDHFSVLEKLTCVLQACVNNALRLTNNQVS